MEYWQMKKEELLSAYSSSDAGLTSAEAALRLAKTGPNQIEAQDKKTPLRIFIAQFQNPMIYVLLAATAIAFVLGEQTEALIILAILMVNAVLGFVQEYRSEKALEELRKYVSMTARVIRGGQTYEIPVEEVAPGDIIHVAIGDIVPADARLTEAHELEVNESILTGESSPVHKKSDVIAAAKVPVHEQTNTIFMGSTVSAGHGVGVVVGTGKETLLGKSAKAIGSADQPTDFEKSIRSFGDMLVRVILIMVVFVFVANAYLGHGLLESFLFALAIAVGITPELLPVIITIGLSQGAMNLVKKNVAVKRLQAIEDLGNMNVLCADKTGTLTENRVELIRYLDSEGKDDEKILAYSLLCNTAVVHHGRVNGGTVDSAIWTYALEKYDYRKIQAYRKVELVEFDYERKRMSAIVEKDGALLMITKGAPEAMLPACTKVLVGGKEVPLSKKIRQVKEMGEKFGSEGYRVISVAYKRPPPKDDYTKDDEHSLVFIGFLIMMDPPKKDAGAALERFKRLGVDMYVLTGDGPLVTEQVCKQVGILNKSGLVLQGMDLAGMDDKELQETVGKHNIFARVTPADKLAIVNALRASGHIVGFIGDGVNDAPSLKAADVGISVSNGTDIAKDAADVVLLSKNLNVIANGIAEGRTTFNNITKYINATISANFGNMFTLTIASIILPFIPLLPSQILLNNLLTDVPMLTISTDSVSKDELRKPKKWNIAQITRFMIFFGLISSVFDLITMGFLLYVISAQTETFRTIWFIESALTEICVIFAIRTYKVIYQSKPGRLLTAASAISAIIVAGITFTPLAVFFQFVQVPLSVLGVIVGIVLAYVAVVEVSKRIFYAMENRRALKAKERGGA
ncbi:MAG TPA: magnesium-translocating P-type ATPase [Candidatus Bilamarchaeum sp.]|nr:magnesium-translocating P-type ATPase [Candidatus Bilamarchaeum sp.]